MLEEPEIADTGDAFLDGVLFAMVSIVALGAVSVGYHALSELLRRKENAKEIEK